MYPKTEVFSYKNQGFQSISFLKKMNKYVVKFYFFRSIEILRWEMVAMVFIVKTRGIDQIGWK